jgi:hypothetical protein
MGEDPDLLERLAETRKERLFEQHLREVFGERHAEFSRMLRHDLRRLWELGRGTAHLRNEYGQFGVSLPEDFKTSPTFKYAAIPNQYSNATPSGYRDTSRPACAYCEGTGLKDAPLPHECPQCDGSGNSKYG